MKKILVTGANGFLGYRFCQILYERGYSVRALVRRKEAIRELNNIAEVKVISEPWDKNSLQTTLVNIDTIIHLAGRAHIVNDRSKNSYELFRIANVDTTRALLEAASNASVTKFLFMSSVIAMRLFSEHILTEKDVCRPTIPYGRSKLEAEGLVKELAGKSKIQYIILRLPLVYGPRNRANMLRLFRLTAKGLPIPLGAVSNRRSFIYVDNAVEAALAALECPAAEGETFLVSDGQDVSTPDLIKMIASAMEKTPMLLPIPLSLLNFFGKIIGKRDEIKKLTGSLSVDSSKIRKMLNWKPSFTLEEGIEETVKWYKSS